jgi:hypothetical protein
MDDFDISEYLGGGFDTGGFDFGDLNIPSLDLSEFTGGGFDVGDFDLGNLDIGNLDLSQFTGGGMDTGGFDFKLGDILAELGSMGTDSGPSSGMGMDKDLLDMVGLGDLVAGGGAATPSLADVVDGKSRTVAEIIADAAGPSDDPMDFGGTFQENMTRGQYGDPMDYGGTFQENMTRGQDGDPMDFGGTPAENIGRAAGSTTGANYTTDAKGNVYKNGSLYRAADEVIDPKDDPYKKISTGNADGKITNPGGVTPKVTLPNGKKGMDPAMMMMLMLLLSQMGKSGGGGSSQASTIPSLSANRSALPYSAPSRPGAGGTTYFSPTTYAPRMAGGGEIVMAGGGIASLGSYSDGGRLLKGPGDGVSDDIPATIAGKQPARLANGEFVVPARIVSELGNGSTDAGADRLYAMMDRVQKARRKTKNVAADTKAHKYLPA